MSKAEYSFDEDLAHRLKNPAFKKAYDSLEPEFMFAKALLFFISLSLTLSRQRSWETLITDLRRVDTSRREHGHALRSLP